MSRTSAAWLCLWEDHFVIHHNVHRSRSASIVATLKAATCKLVVLGWSNVWCGWLWIDVILGRVFENLLRELYGHWSAVVSDWSGIGTVQWLKSRLWGFGHYVSLVSTSWFFVTVSVILMGLRIRGWRNNID